MRRSIVFVAALLAGTLLAGAQPALALTPTAESIPGFSGQPVEQACAFPVAVTQRDPRTLTTWSDGRGGVLLQTVKTKTSTTFSNRTSGLEMPLDEQTLVTVRPNRDGTSTIVFAGRGAIWGTDTGLGQPFITWVTGLVLMRGSFDVKTGSFTVSSKAILGQSTDLCDSLATGLKPRH
jgi:hypothetical protein